MVGGWVSVEAIIFFAVVALLFLTGIPVVVYRVLEHRRERRAAEWRPLLLK
jgi:hypothetical protein